MSTLPRDINYTMEQLIARRPFAEGNPVSDDMLAPTNSLLLGNVQRTATATGRTATVKAGEDIRPALESLRSAGGGTLVLLQGTHIINYDIIGFSGLNIVGIGAGQTILDFNAGSYQIDFSGSVSDVLEHFTIRDLSITNSDANEAILLSYCDFWTIQNVSIYSTVSGCRGIRVYFSQNFTVVNVSVDSCGGSGFEFFGSTGGRLIKDFSIINCTASSNSGRGFYVNDTSGASDYSFMSCVAEDNTSSGFHISHSDGFEANGSLVQCVADGNAVNGMLLDGDNIQAVGCVSRNNTQYGFNVLGDIYLIGCQATGNGGAYSDIRLFEGTGTRPHAIGCRVDFDTSTAPSSKILFTDVSANESPSNIIGTTGGSLRTERKIVQMYNNSGSAVAIGDIVVFDANASGEYFTTTTTQGDDKVLGMAQTAISNGEYGPILVKGYTTKLKVNGTTDIAVGDFLCTYTSAGIAAKAGSGDMAIAYALEAYTTDNSNGVVNALLITPRKI